MRKTLPAALAVLLLSPAAAPAGPGHGGGGSHGGGSHGGGSHGGGSHGGGSHGGGSHRGGRHGGRGRVIFGGPYWGGWGWWSPYYYGDYYGPGYGPDGDGRPLRNGREPNDEEAGAVQDQAPPPAAERQKGDAWRQRAPATTSPARQRARLLLSVQPGDAAVYLDDRFLGTAEELGLTDGGVPVTLGRHTITVSRPGFKSRTVEIDVARGDAKNADVSLDK